MVETRMDHESVLKTHAYYAKAFIGKAAHDDWVSWDIYRTDYQQSTFILLVSKEMENITKPNKQLSNFKMTREGQEMQCLPKENCICTY
ncbi:hypothetical protein GN958_ATG03403 [Phytophthora infestans]|uniref:Uncharacterized protein n=1 Tax=Phytophthora infestans TaxID=4787 RepID=A0A8S9V7Q4_PHYIN|nr:hypothetical protein GN958_ATG03403 [Phytophthora infestans]